MHPLRCFKQPVVVSLCPPFCSLKPEGATSGLRKKRCIVLNVCSQGQGGGVLPRGNWSNPEEALTACFSSLFLSVTEALHFQQKLDETTKLLRDLQEAQKERLSAKQPPNMICLMAPTQKEMELGKSLEHLPVCLFS